MRVGDRGGTALADRLAVARQRFADAIDTLDAQAATETIGEALRDGLDPVDLIEDVIAPSQRLVGERWERGEWTVAQQHAATGLATAAVCALDAAMPAADRGLVVLACAEREWHALPLQLIGATLRAGGWQVSLLGSAVTASRLSRTLHELGPDAVGVSSSVLVSIPNARRCVEASTTAGIPIVGGPAFGTSAHRAQAIGATAWAPTARDLPAVLATLPNVVRPVPPLPRAVVTEQAGLDAQQAGLVVRLAARWRPAGRHPARHGGRPRRRRGPAVPARRAGGGAAGRLLGDRRHPSLGPVGVHRPRGGRCAGRHGRAACPGAAGAGRVPAVLASPRGSRLAGPAPRPSRQNWPRYAVRNI